MVHTQLIHFNLLVLKTMSQMKKKRKKKKLNTEKKKRTILMVKFLIPLIITIEILIIETVIQVDGSHQMTAILMDDRTATLVIEIATTKVKEEIDTVVIGEISGITNREKIEDIGKVRIMDNETDTKMEEILMKKEEVIVTILMMIDHLIEQLVGEVVVVGGVVPVGMDILIIVSKAKVVGNKVVVHGMIVEVMVAI